MRSTIGTLSVNGYTILNTPVTPESQDQPGSQRQQPHPQQGSKPIAGNQGPYIFRETQVMCFKCSEIGHFSTQCIGKRKAKVQKENGLPERIRHPLGQRSQEIAAH